MTHVAFVTLFLGLVIGPQEVELHVTGPAARVELQVDGQVAAVCSREPWKMKIDLGPRLLPHRFVARALDENGAELARAEQSVNMPRRTAEVQLVLEQDGEGEFATVRVLWQSVEADRPTKIALSLDSKPLAVDRALLARIPRVDTSRPHLLRVHTTAPSGALAESELAFGGGLEAESGSDLTAVGVRLRGTPPSELIRQSLRVGGETARVIAIEDLPGDVIIVRNPEGREVAKALDPFGLSTRQSSATFTSAIVAADLATHPKPIARFVWPISERSRATHPVALFPHSPSFQFTSADDLKALIAQFGHSVRGVAPEYADAVAVAGAQAIQVNRPRAVLLILGHSRRDGSYLTPHQVREYLQSIGVPLHVWSVGSSNAAERGWGDVADISKPRGFRLAFEALQNDLKSQRIVWIEGDHLPPEVVSISHAVETLAKQSDRNR